MKNYPKGLESQKEIINTATALFGVSGYYRTSIQKIADKMGVSQSAIFHHYKTKEALFGACVKNAVEVNHEMVTERTEASDNPLTKLEKHFTGNLDWCFENPDQAKLISLLFYLSTFDTNMRKFLDVAMETGESRILEHLKKAKSEGLLQLRNKAETEARALHDLLFGHLLKMISLDANRDASSKMLTEKIKNFFESRK